MALWPTCPARGLPDTEERSSRKSKQQKRKHSLFPFPLQSRSIKESDLPVLQLMYLMMGIFADNDGFIPASPRTTPRSLSI